MPSVSVSGTYNLRPLVPMARWLRARLGEDAFGELCAVAGLEPAWFDEPDHPLTHEQLEGLLVAARARVASTDEFMEAAAFESPSVSRALAWATDPGLAYAGRATRNGFFSAAGRIECTRRGLNFAHVRYTSASPESRLMCLVRQAQLVNAPRAWRLPAAVVREERCLARHDDACEYVVHWVGRPRGMVSVLGAVAGLACLAALVGGGLGSVPLVGWALPVAGAVLGYLLESRRMERANRRTREEFSRAFGHLAEAAGRAQRERVVAPVEVVPSAPPASTEVTPDPTAFFLEEGQFWRIGWGGTAILLRHTRGLALLASLLRNAGMEVHVSALDALTPSGTGRGTLPSPPPSAALPEDVSPGLGDAGEVLDARAKANYRRRLTELREELADAESCNDPGRAATAQAEIEALADQLRTATGLGGRDRRASSDVDRVRVAVTRRIRAAIALIAKHHPSLAEHFEASVRTGYFCAYEPAGEPVVWTT